jgi:hypothetical protein
VKTRHESVPTRAACRGSSPRIHPKSRETAGLSGCTASHAEVGAVFAAEVFTPRPTPTMCHAPARLPRGHVHDVHRGTERERLGHEVAPTSLPPVPATQHTRCLPAWGLRASPAVHGSSGTPHFCVFIAFVLSSQLSSCVSRREIPHVDPVTPRRPRWSTFLSLKLTSPSGGGEREQRR